MELKVRVKGQTAWCQERVVLTASTDVLDAVFEFDEHWNGMTKTVLFTRNGVTKTRLLSKNRCTVPNELIKNGGIVISVVGAKDGQIITTTNQCAVILYLSGYIPNITIGKPNDDVFTDILKELELHNQLAHDIEAQAEEVKSMADELYRMAIEKTEINEAGELVITYKSGNQVNLGRVVGRDGERGEKGEKGDDGERGVTTQVGGFFTLAVDARGDLWAYSEDDIIPEFEYDPETGLLYFVSEQE